MKTFNYEMRWTGLVTVLALLLSTTTCANHHHHQGQPKVTPSSHRRSFTRRSALEVGYIVGVTSPDAHHHHPLVVHHDAVVIPHDAISAHAGVGVVTKVIAAVKTDTHVVTHDVVVHPHVVAHAIAAAAHVAHVVAHGTSVVTHDAHVVIHDAKPHVLHETHVISHDVKSVAKHHSVHDVVLIPIGHGHTVTFKHHDVPDDNPLRSHLGGYGVGIDFGGHGAGHGFYASQNNNLF